MRRGVAVAVLFIGQPAGIEGCAACVAGATHESIVLNEKYGPGPPDLATATSARPQPKPPPPPRGRIRVALKSDDVVEEDEAGNITAIRHATSPATWTRFKRGAVSPTGVDWVEGELAAP
jgi:hypothetical protein